MRCDEINVVMLCINHHLNMKKIIFFLLCIATGNVQAQSSTYLSEMITKWEHAKKYTLEVANAMPDSAYGFSPANGEMTFGNQLSHLGENMIWLSSKYLKNEKPPFDKIAHQGVAKIAVVENVTRAFDYALAALQSLKPENLEETVDFFAGKMTKRQIINLMNDHLTHHNSQCLVYLRLKGIKPPDYVGW